MFISNEGDYLIKHKIIDCLDENEFPSSFFSLSLRGIGLINEFHANVNRTKTCQSILCQQ